MRRRVKLASVAACIAATAAIAQPVAAQYAKPEMQSNIEKLRSP